MILVTIEVSKVENQKREQADATKENIIIIMLVKKVKKEDKKVSSFIVKLLNMLNDQENKLYIGWADIPNAFVIFDTNELAKNVLPKYFKHNNLSSFIRQLNIYNFDKIKTEENQHFYHHPYLSKDNKKLLKKIQRKGHFEKEKNKKSYQSDDSSFCVSSSHPVFQKKNDQKRQLSQENEDLKQQIVQVEKKCQQQIKKVTNFFTMLLKDFSSFQFLQIQELQKIFHNEEKRKSILQKFDQSELCMKQNPMGFILNREYFQRKQGQTKDESGESNNNRQTFRETKEAGVENLMMEQDDIIMDDDNIVSGEDEGFLPLQEAQKQERKEKMKYQKLYQ